MSRTNPLHWIGGVALEIGAVAGVVMLLPKADLRPDRATAAVEHMPLPPPLQQQPAWWQAAPQAAATSWQPPPRGGSFAVDAPPILTVDPRVPHAVVEQTAWQPAAEASPAGPAALPQLSPAAVEATLDRASQQLLNSVGGYFLGQAEDALPATAAPAPHAAAAPLAAPASAAPQPWRRY